MSVVLLLVVAGAATSAHAPTSSIVSPPSNFSALLARHAMDFRFKWDDDEGRYDYLPTSWLTGPFTGNGVIGTVLYFCDPPDKGGAASRGGLCWKGNSSSEAELRIELGRQDLYSNRNPTDNFWSGIRLPVGYVRVVTKGKLLGGTLSLSLWDAEVVGTLMTSAGNISLRIFTHATQPLTLFESNCSGNEEAAVVFVATTRCVNRWDVAGLVPCGMRPNPPAECTTTTEEANTTTICTQAMKEDEGDRGSFATAIVAMRQDPGRLTAYITTSSALWPHDVTTDPRVEARSILTHAQSVGNVRLRQEHCAWWHSFWPLSFLSIPVTRVEGFYYIEMYKIASSSRENGPMKDEIGPWYVDTEWPGYWYDLNSELTYYPVGASNRLVLGRNLGRQFKLNVDNGHLARNVLRTEPTWNGSMSIGASGNGMQVGGQPGDLVWITSDLWALCEYEFNATCHADYLLPVLRGAVGIFEHYLTEIRNGTKTDQLHVPQSNLPNCGGGGWDNSFDLGAAHWGLHTFVSLCEAIEQESLPFVPGADFDRARAAELCGFRSAAALMLSKLAPLQISDTGINAAWETPFVQPCRHFDHLLPCNPWEMYPTWNSNSTPGTSLPTNLVCTRTLDQFYTITWGGHADCTFSYPPVSQMSASIGRGEAAWGNITRVTDWVTSIMPNTMDNEGDPVPSSKQIVNIDPCATAALADSVQYMMLQSHNARIQVFPAVPEAWDKGAVFFRLRAMRAFLVSARIGAKALKWVQIESIAGAQPVIVTVPFQTNVSGLSVETLPRDAKVILSHVAEQPTTFEIHGLEAGMTVLIRPLGSSMPDVKPIESNSSELKYWGYHPDSPRSRAFNECCGH
eukprot:m.232590 g.232590  ORF g.232590 m.232590 type:complete len:852 (-) comp15717_c0_seq3:218-2773(-)